MFNIKGGWDYIHPSLETFRETCFLPCPPSRQTCLQHNTAGAPGPGVHQQNSHWFCLPQQLGFNQLTRHLEQQKGEVIELASDASGSSVVLRSTLLVSDDFPVFWCPAQQEQGPRPQIPFKFPAFGMINIGRCWWKPTSFVAESHLLLNFLTLSGSDPFFYDEIACD